MWEAEFTATPAERASGLSTALDGIYDDPIFAALSEGPRLYTTGVVSILEGATGLPIGRIVESPEAALEVLDSALNGTLDYALTAETKAVVDTIEDAVNVLTEYALPISGAASFAGGGIAAACVAIANALVSAFTAESVRQSAKNIANASCYANVRKLCMQLMIDEMPPPVGKLSSTGASGTLMPGDLFGSWLPIYRNLAAGEGVSSSGCSPKLVKGTWYPWGGLCKPAVYPPVGISTLYHLLCGAEAFSQSGLVPRSVYGELVAEARGYNPIIGIPQSTQTRLAKLIRGLVYSTSAVSTSSDNGRALLPIVNAILILEHDRGRWDEPFLRFLFDRVVLERIVASGKGALPWYFAEKDPVSVCNCRELLDYGSSPAQRDFLVHAFVEGLLAQRGALDALIQELVREETGAHGTKFIMAARPPTGLLELMVTETSPTPRRVVAKPAWRAPVDVLVGGAGVAAAGYLSWAGMRRWGPRR